MSDSVNLRAQVEILSSVAEELQSQGHEDRQAIRALMRDLAVLVRNLERLPDLVDRVEDAVKDTGPTALWRTSKMARELGMNPEALRKAAWDGRIPAYQSTKGGAYYFDPREVKAALKGERNVPAV